MATNGKKKIIAPPWYRDGSPERWVTAGRFARLMNRTPSTVRLWLTNGTLKDFGFAYYRDISGRLFIRISPDDLVALRRIEQTRKSKAPELSA